MFTITEHISHMIHYYNSSDGFSSQYCESENNLGMINVLLDFPCHCTKNCAVYYNLSVEHSSPQYATNHQNL